jgi:hypothetical protein
MPRYPQQYPELRLFIQNSVSSYLASCVTVTVASPAPALPDASVEVARNVCTLPPEVSALSARSHTSKIPSRSMLHQFKAVGKRENAPRALPRTSP